ncbi:MAG: hypothetical protein QM642_06175 [Edaphocola sp.]
MIEHISKDGIIFAIIIRSTYSSNGIEFFSPPDLPMQLGYMKRPKDYVIEAHKHSFVTLQVDKISETLFIKSGEVHAYLYDENDALFTECTLKQGDVVMFTGYGHRFKVLEEAEIIEVKQGPYSENKISINNGL